MRPLCKAENAILGFVTTCALGGLGGYLLAGRPFAELGAVFGVVFAAPFAAILAAISARYNCSNLLISVGQFVGAMSLGVVMLDEFRRDAAFYWPMSGQVIGGAITLVTLLSIRKQGPASGFCTKCGYNLTGNASGICPECGTTIAAD